MEINSNERSSGQTRGLTILSPRFSRGMSIWSLYLICQERFLSIYQVSSREIGVCTLYLLSRHVDDMNLARISSISIEEGSASIGEASRSKGSFLSYRRVPDNDAARKERARGRNRARRSIRHWRVFVGSAGLLRSGLPGHPSVRPSVRSFPPSSVPSSFIRRL